MNYALFVGRIKRASDLANDFDYPRQRHRAFLTNNFLQSTAIQKLHHQEDHTILRFAEVCDAEGMWMGNAGRRAGVTREAGDDLFIGSEGGTQHFYLSLIH